MFLLLKLLCFFMCSIMFSVGVIEAMAGHYVYQQNPLPPVQRLVDKAEISFMHAFLSFDTCWVMKLI